MSFISHFRLYRIITSKLTFYKDEIAVTHCDDPPVLPKCGNTKAFMLTRMTVLTFTLVSGLSVKQYKTHLLLTTCLGQNVGRRSFLSTGSARIIIFKMNS